MPSGLSAGGGAAAARHSREAQRLRQTHSAPLGRLTAARVAGAAHKSKPPALAGRRFAWKIRRLLLRRAVGVQLGLGDRPIGELAVRRAVLIGVRLAPLADRRFVCAWPIRRFICAVRSACHLRRPIGAAVWPIRSAIHLRRPESWRSCCVRPIWPIRLRRPIGVSSGRPLAESCASSAPRRSAFVGAADRRSSAGPRRVGANLAASRSADSVADFSASARLALGHACWSASPGPPERRAAPVRAVLRPRDSAGPG